jgi:mono/diheme cytochrome c family protein
MNISVSQIRRLTIIAFAVASFTFLALTSGSSEAFVTAAGDAAGTFKARCATCHGADGSGNTAMGKKMKVRDLRSAEVQKQSDAELFNIISKGKAKMPAFGKSLGDDQIQQLVAHIRALKK